MSSFRLDLEFDGRVQSLTFDRPSVTIGRDPDSDVFLDHPTVSRQHSLIVGSPQGYSLVVLSQNGLTGVDGNKVEGSVAIQNGARLQFGQFLATFHSDHGNSATVPFTPVVGRPLLQEGATQPGVSQHPGMGAGILHDSPTAAIPAIGTSQPQGFGQQAQPQGFGQQAQPQGFGQQAQPQGFGQQAQPQQFSASPPAVAAKTGAISNPQTSHGIVSWDDIAKQATTDDPREKAETHFERMKAASEKNRKQGTNPIVLLVVALVAIGATYFLVFADDGGGDGDGPIVVVDKAEIQYLADDFACLKPDGCLDAAEGRYNIGIENLKKKQADVGNLFRGYMSLDMADRFAQASGKPRPKSMVDLDAKRAEALAELKTIEQNYQVQYHRSHQRRAFDDMVAAINGMRSQFPDIRSRVYKDADDKEMYMKENAILPKKGRK
jgi:hypothetical protein